MIFKVKFSPVSEAQKNQLNLEVKPFLNEEDYKFFANDVAPYTQFGYDQLDNIFLIAELIVEGNGTIKTIDPNCTVDQADWVQCYDEPDIAIEPIYIDLKLIAPALPIEVAGEKRFFVVFQSEMNLWDCCKDLPQWIWSERKFEFMLAFDLITEDGQTYHGNGGGNYANQLIKF